MDQRSVPPPPLISPAALTWLRKPQFLLPLAVVVGMTVVAFAVQPGGARGETPPAVRTSTATLAAQALTTTPTTAPTRPASTAAATVPAQQATQSALVQPQEAATGGAAAQQMGSDVAGIRGTPPATATSQPQPDLSHESTQCGAMQETSVPLAIEQTINGVSVKATKSSSYPIEYFRCILMATGTQEAFTLASSVSKAQSAGMTHTILIDLWITNAGKDFGQVTLKDAQLAAAGQLFAPLATLGGRADVVVSSGQGRNVTLVIAIKTSVGPTTGPMTLTIGSPLFGGKPTAGKYSLFLPTP